MPGGQIAVGCPATAPSVPPTTCPAVLIAPPAIAPAVATAPPATAPAAFAVPATTPPGLGAGARHAPACHTVPAGQTCASAVSTAPAVIVPKIAKPIRVFRIAFLRI